MVGSTLDWITPSTMPIDLLEAMFIDRDALLGELMDQIRTSATTQSKSYLLVFGPRGIGKTHLVTLINHQVTTDEGLSKRLCVAWLQEDPYGIETYSDLLKTIIEQLAKDYQDDMLAATVEKLQQLPFHDVASHAEREIQNFLEQRTLLIIVENLESILDNLRRDGQEKLRAFLQTYRKTTILTTSTSLLDSILAKQSKPFFGTFSRYVKCRKPPACGDRCRRER
jgi:Cdc6-like AAA superfamily ATPase